jgi:hypothetical protein
MPIPQPKMIPQDCDQNIYEDGGDEAPKVGPLQATPSRPDGPYLPILAMKDPDRRTLGGQGDEFGRRIHLI